MGNEYLVDHLCVLNVSVLSYGPEGKAISCEISQNVFCLGSLFLFIYIYF